MQQQNSHVEVDAEGWLDMVGARVVEVTAQSVGAQPEVVAEEELGGVAATGVCH